MFWKKKKKIKQKDEDLSVRLTVIPEIFYGGADPLVYHEQKVGKRKEKMLKTKDEKGLSKMSKKKFILIVVIASVVLVVGVSAYYFNASKVGETVPPKIDIQPEEPKVVVPTPEEPRPTVATTTPEVVEPPPEPPADRPLEFPRILLKDSSDIDIDSLTDLEEELFNTDSGIWDTDDDGYYDGQELFNLYNPTGFAPVKLIDSGLVREYANPKWQYRVYYPISWEAASVDPQSDHVIFSSITADFIEIRAIEHDSSETFESWFAKNISGQRFTDLSKFDNRFDVSGLKRRDSLVAYFVGDNVVYVMVYQPAGNASDIPFRHVMQIMYQSFRSSEVFVDIPEQDILPGLPDDILDI